MKNLKQFSLIGFLSLLSMGLNAQITEHFSDETVGANSFSTSGSNFTITGGRMSVTNYATYGWTGTDKDDYYVDNYGIYPAAAGVLGSFKLSSNTMNVNYLYVFPGETGDFVKNTGTVIIRGKLSGVTQFTKTIASIDINTASFTDNGWTFVDLTSFNSYKVDEIEFEVTDALRYLAVDAFKFKPSAPPSVTSVAVPADKTYKIGDALDFTVQFDQTVDVNGTPSLPITLNTGGTVYATYQSGSGSKNLVFRYTVANGQLDADGITIVSPLLLNGGTIMNGTTNAGLSLIGVGATTGIKVDGVAPAVIGLSLVNSKANYVTGDVISFELNMTENVTVTGSPYLVITIGSKQLYAVYASTLSKNINFNYTVQANDFDSDGINCTPSIILNGGSVKDIVGNSYVLMPAPNIPFSSNNVNVVVTSIADANPTANVAVYPNPTSDVINLTSVEGVESINITNLAGNTVWSGSVAEFPLSVSSFAKGIYLVNILSADGVKTEKVVIK